MKTYTAIIVLLAMIFSGCGCDPERMKEEIKEIGIKHTLRKFNVKTSTSQSASAWYFYVAGGYSSHTSEKTTVRFYFKNCKGEYQFMEMDLGKVRIKIDSVQEPYVIIVPAYSQDKCFDIDAGHSDWEIRSATVYCKESDFQPEININDLR